MIILDLDGVLLDFNKAAHVALCIPYKEPTSWNWFTEYGYSESQFWDVIHSYGDRFYGEMIQPYPWKDEILGAVCHADDFVIMSAPSNHPGGYAAKKIACDLYAPNAELIVGRAKHLLADNDRLLIDDSDINISKFRECGGSALTFPQPWNTNRHVINRTTLVTHFLKEWKYRKDV